MNATNPGEGRCPVSTPGAPLTLVVEQRDGAVTEDALAGLYLLVRDEHPSASVEEIAQLMVLRFTDEQTRDLAAAALA